MLHERVSSKSMMALLSVLELIKTRMGLEKLKENPKGNPAQKSEKRTMTSYCDCIPKNPTTFLKPNKHCDLCAKHGGMPKMHNMSECNKYQADGTPKKQVGHSNGKHDHKKRGNSYAALLQEIRDLKRDVKRDRKKRSKKRKRDYALSDSNSDSS